MSRHPINPPSSSAAEENNKKSNFVPEKEQTKSLLQQQDKGGAKSAASVQQSNKDNDTTATPAYQNTKGLILKSKQAAAAAPDFKKRKPVPLPRSRVTQLSSKSQPSVKEKEKPKPVQRNTGVTSRLFWKRSKTDLGAETLATYKANKSANLSATASPKKKSPAPRVPTFNRPIPQSQELTANIVVPHVQRRYSTVSRREAKSVPVVAATAANKPKPEIKVKPTFSTFNKDNSFSNSPKKKPASLSEKLDK